MTLHILMRLGLGLAFFFTLTTSRAEDSLPIIQSFSSPKTIIAEQGDQLNLEVTTATPVATPLQVSWRINETTLCKTNKCNIQTKSLSLGRHPVVFSISNTFESIYIEYQIILNKKKLGQRNITHTPTQISDQAHIKRISKNLIGLRLMQGSGYYKIEKRRSISPVRRNIGWEGEIGTQTGGYAYLDLPNQHDHILYPRTKLKFNIIDDHKTIELLRGTIQSRSLSQEQPAWSITADDWLQIHFLPGSDGVVRATKNGTFQLFCLQGNLAVLSNFGNHILKRGHSLILNKQSSTFTPFAISQKNLWPLLSRENSILRPDPYYTSKDTTTAEFAKDLWINEQLYKLANLPTSKDTDEATQLYVAAANIEIFNFPKAEKMLNAILHNNEDLPFANYLMGYIELMKQNWESAYNYFDKSDLEDPNHIQSNRYYKGVSEFYSNNYKSAKYHFIESTWTGDNDTIESSSGKFISNLRDLSDFHFESTVNLFRTTNAPGLNPELLPKNLEGVVDNGLEVTLVTEYKVISEPNAQTYLFWNLSAINNMNSQFKEYNWAKTALGIRSQLTLINSQTNPLDVTLSMGLGSAFAGGERSLDQFRFLPGIFLKNIGALHIEFPYIMTLDPILSENDHWDPYEGEVVSAGEKSRVYSGISINIPWQITEKLSSKNRLEYAQNQMRSRSQNSNNYSAMHIATDLHYPWAKRWHSDFTLSLLNKSYLESRNDQLTSVLTKTGWSFTPRTTINLHVDLQQKSSSEEILAHSKHTFKLGASTEF